MPRGIASVGIDTVPMPERPIRVVIPASVAFNLDKFQSVFANLAERLGCPQCLSGRNCMFLLERDYVVNPDNLKLESMMGGAIVHG